MKRTLEPVFRDLAPEEAAELLANHHVGRIAYSFHDHVDIEPISYVYADGAIYMRTSPGSKLATIAHAPWVAFEVDEVRGPLEWRSVIVHGTVYLLRQNGPPNERVGFRHAVDRLRTIMPDALSDDDPTPERKIVLKLHLDTVSGREARLEPAIKEPSQRQPQAARSSVGEPPTRPA